MSTETQPTSCRSLAEALVAKYDASPADTAPCVWTINHTFCGEILRPECRPEKRTGPRPKQAHCIYCGRVIKLEDPSPMPKGAMS